MGAAHSAVSLADGGALAHDDVKLNVLAQSWRAGYLDDNPPLFEWFLRAAQLAVGPVEASFLVLKYGLLALAGVFTFSAAREAVRDPRWAAIAALAMSLNPQIGWAYHEAFTHSAALVAAMALFWWRLLVAIRTGSAADAALLGLALGAGALAKYSFLGAAGAASIAVVVGAIKGRMPMIRVGRMGVLAVATALALVWPHAAWRAANVAQSGAAWSRRTARARPSPPS
ncbi:MAG: glycosyltransferase family 39 protein [Parvularculaceae bacterium]